MASSTVDPVTRRVADPIASIVVGVAVPLADIAIVYALWWISDRLGRVGPLDRAAFGWVVIIPLWISAPIVAGFAWHRLSERGSTAAAVIVGAVVSGVAAVLFWQAVAYPACEFGATHTPGDWLLPSLLVGIVIGGGMAASGVVATTHLRLGHPWRAAVLGAGAGLVVVMATLVVSAAMLLGPGCQRPPI